MPRSWPVNDIPETGASVLVPVGPYRTRPSVTESQSTTGKLMYVGLFRLSDAHAEYAGVPLYENFVIGSDQDPDAQDPETWKKSIGARRMRQCFTAGGVAPSEDVDDMLDELNADGHDVMVLNQHEISTNPRTGESGPRNKIVSFFPVSDDGRRPVAAATAAATAPKASPTPLPPKPTPARAVAAGAKPAPSVRPADGYPCAICKVELGTEVLIPRKEYAAHLREIHPDE